MTRKFVEGRQVFVGGKLQVPQHECYLAHYMKRMLQPCLKSGQKTGQNAVQNHSPLFLQARLPSTAADKSFVLQGRAQGNL